MHEVLATGKHQILAHFGILATFFGGMWPRKKGQNLARKTQMTYPDDPVLDRSWNKGKWWFIQLRGPCINARKAIESSGDFSAEISQLWRFPYGPVTIPRGPVFMVPGPKFLRVTLSPNVIPSPQSSNIEHSHANGVQQVISSPTSMVLAEDGGIDVDSGLPWFTCHIAPSTESIWGIQPTARSLPRVNAVLGGRELPWSPKIIGGLP